MVSALDGVVTKAALFVRPSVAHHKELLAMTKYKLHEAGFIVVHEEYRRVNDEMADTIAIQLDREVYESGNTSPLMVETTPSPQRLFTYAHAIEVPSGPQGLVGHVYLYVLAHRDCHTELLRFLDRIFADEEYTSLLIELQENHKSDEKGTKSQQQQQQQQQGKKERIECPLFCNATANGAKQVVQLLFPRMLVHDVPNAAATHEYVQAKLKGALLPALVELSRAKPDNPIRWLAERLLNTNTRAPPLISASNVENARDGKGAS